MAGANERADIRDSPRFRRDVYDRLIIGLTLDERRNDEGGSARLAKPHGDKCPRMVMVRPVVITLAFSAAVEEPLGLYCRLV